MGSMITLTSLAPKSISPRSSDTATNRYPSPASVSSSVSTRLSAERSISSVQSPPEPRVPVSRARSLVLGASSSIPRRPDAARRDIPSQSASRAERVEVMLNLCCQSGFSVDEAVAYRGGRLVVLGVAGSGKTRLIEQRFAWLVDRGVAPEQIAVVAASPARAAALRAKIEVDLGQAYEQLWIGSPIELAALILGADSLESLLGAGDRLAMLLERIDELSLAHHDFGGSPSALLGRFVRRIDRLKEESIGAEKFAAWADALADAREGPSEREFAEVYRTHEQMLADACARDQGDLLRDALKLVRS